METPIPPKKAPGRNDPCHCGSGKKYKQCHLEKDEQAARDARATATAEAEKNAPPAETPKEDEKPAVKSHDKPNFHEQRGRGGANTKGFQRASSVRKVGGGS
ncbi:MAG: SEC-C metal-binding domain-containing protein [Vicinamibacteria bacterium]